MKFGFDTNLFIYSFDRTTPAKQARARVLLEVLLDRSTVVPMQVISEALNAAQRKRHLSAPSARLACEALAASTPIEAAIPRDALAASELAAAHGLQFFDAQIVTFYSRLGATMLLSEDLQDGRRFDALRIVNPFNAANDDLLRPLLTPLP